MQNCNMETVLRSILDKLHAKSSIYISRTLGYAYLMHVETKSQQIIIYGLISRRWFQ
jgi:recombinational DNA repair protein RecT